VTARRALIVGIGRTAYTRGSGRTTLGMAAEACRAALADAGMPTSEVDGLVSFSTGDSARTIEVAYALGIDGLAFPLDLSGGGNVASLVVAQAAAAVEAGACEAALVYRSLNSLSGHRYGRVEGRLEAAGYAQFGAPHGYLVPGQWFAMFARRHMHEHGTTCEDLGQIAIQTRAHAVRNPHALLREPLDMEQYLASRWIYEPFRLFDCALESDGAAAVLVTTRERARDLAQPPVRMLGHAAWMGAGAYTDQWPDMTRMYSAQVAPRLWDETGLGPAEMDIACLYDCFTYTTLGTFEDYGFCDKGGAGKAFAEGRATYGGDVVVNPHGGLLSEAYIHGMNHHYEAVLQLRGQAGERQVEDARLCLVSAGTGPYGGALVYAKD
jgi:acetyl-CoA acetyltransferase